MARERHLRAIDINNVPELLRLVEQLRNSNEPLLLQEASRDVAIVRPVKRSRKQRIPSGRPTSADDPLWKIVGMAEGEDDGIRDVSSNKHKYLAEAYADLHE